MLQDHWHEACSGSDAGPHACQSSFNIFIGCLGALQHLFSGICVTVAAQLSAHPDSVLSGSALLAAAHLVSEPATWVCLFMTSWQHVYAKKKTGIKSKDSMGHQLDSSQKIVRQHLERLVQAYIAGLQLVLAAVNTCLKVSTKALVADATQMALGSSENEQSGLAQTITECLPQADVQACLTVIVENEKLLLKRIKLQLSEQLSAV